MIDVRVYGKWLHSLSAKELASRGQSSRACERQPGGGLGPRGGGGGQTARGDNKAEGAETRASARTHRDRGRKGRGANPRGGEGEKRGGDRGGREEMSMISRGRVWRLESWGCGSSR